MSSLNTISIDRLTRFIGTPACPTPSTFRPMRISPSTRGLFPGAVRRPWAKAAEWAAEFDGRSAGVVCQGGAEAQPWCRRMAAPSGRAGGGARGRHARALGTRPRCAWRRKRRACSRPRPAFHRCSPRICRSSKPGCSVTTRSTAAMAGEEGSVTWRASPLNAATCAS
jgi:hypothetical protein